VCALNDVYSSLKEAREWKSLTCGVKPETLVSRKGESSDALSEVSGTANTCTDEQELHKRHIVVDECAQQHEVRTEFKATIRRCSGDR
jgi:hypothetical protein